MSELKVYNRTNLTEEEISRLKMLGATISLWRKRDIILYQHPEKEDSVISVGVDFDKTQKVISEETKVDWAIALEYAAQNKVYISE